MKFSEVLPCEIFWGRCCRKAKHLVMQFTSLSCRGARSQRGGVTPFAVSIWMARAHLAGQGGDGAGPLSAVFAGVFRGFIALIESMSALADSVRMTGACGAGQRLDARISVPTVFAVELRHDERFLFVVFVELGGLRPQSGLSDVLLFVPGVGGPFRLRRRKGRQGCVGYRVR